ncbi:MAG: NAD-dependent epimerase/dehydratase family protein [Oscillospiraceae bacterium]|jgi:nucleoside-diphosphate-sugar epimerase|nr:NAD-dependent epimerase/dehydratase family protein [Oscillospiraceae bacterium]
MKKAVVIGGRGKVGGYLVPMLVEEGFEVACVSRGQTEPFAKQDAWRQVRQVNLDRSAADFADAVRALGADVVVDMICFEDADMRRLIGTLRGAVAHYLVCGSVWMHGPSGAVPVLEEEGRFPLEAYGVEKDKMDKTIARAFAEHAFPGTAVHPGHIVCPGDVPINPQGCKSLDAFYTLRAGAPLYLPNFGMETLHHVHARDVAGVFLAAIRAGAPAFGQGFHAVSPRAVTLRGYALEAAGWYGRQADLRFEPYDVWKTRVSEEEAEATLSHIAHSPSASTEKAARLLGFAPRYTSFEAIRECLASLDAL